MQHYNIDIDTLAPIICLKNPNNLPIHLNLVHPPQSSKEIFTFCSDLFWKCIHVMYTNESKKVIINDLSIENIYATINKLKNAKIRTNINVHGKESDVKRYKSIIENSIQTVKEMNDHELLEKYFLLIPLNEYIYKITFTLLR